MKGVQKRMAEREKKASKSGRIIILAIILAVVFAVFLTDLGGIKTQLLSFFGGEDAEEVDYEAMEQALLEKESELESKLEEIKQYENRLNNKERELREMESQLELFEMELEQQKLEFEGLQTEFEQLTKMYSKMEPDKAAEILENMEDQQLVIRILTGIKEAVAAEILSYMDSETAARLTMEMAP
ncbi:MAG TPA: hypothetical protein GXZ32_09305 [Clostridiales bacterium]|nr:hypothetical protein [Clostridiales bacterium]